MRSSTKAARAAASTAAGAGVPGWPTSRWMTEWPSASRSLAARSTSIAIKGGTRPRREGPGIVSGPAAAGGVDDPAGRGGMPQQAVGRADRPAHQLAAAIRATPGQNALGAVAAEGALIGAYARLDRIGHQVAVAAF